MATKQASKYKPMPAWDEVRSGCKVGWRYYKDEAVAREAAKIAEYNGMVAWDAGYDFGYHSPGSCKKMKDDLQGEWAKYAGLWEVCVL